MVWLREGGNWPESVLLLYFSRQWDHRPNGAVFWRWRRRCWMRHCVDCGWVVQTFLRKKKIPHWSAACRSWSHTAGCDRSIAVAAIVVRHLISWFCVFFAISDSLWRPNPVTAELCPPFGEPVSQMWLVPPTGPSFWRNYRPSRKPFRKQRHNINSRGNWILIQRLARKRHTQHRHTLVFPLVESKPPVAKNQRFGFAISLLILLLYI